MLSQKMFVKKKQTPSYYSGLLGFFSQSATVEPLPDSRSKNLSSDVKNLLNMCNIAYGWQETEDEHIDVDPRQGKSKFVLFFLTH